MSPRQTRMLRAVSAALVVAPVVVFALAAWQRRWMDDDGFINLRIVRNLLEGHGLVYNAGERVETGTSPLWLAVLAVAGKLGARLERAAVVIGVMFAAFGLALGTAGALRIDRPKRDEEDRRNVRDALTIPWGAALIAVLPPAWDYASAGLEMGLVFLWLGGAFFAVTSIICTDDEASRSGAAPSSISRAARNFTAGLVGLGILIRPELALYVCAFMAALLFFRGTSGAGETAWKARIERVFAALAIPVAYQIFRMGYFGALTPNTAIAKEAFGANWTQGACYSRNFFLTYHLPWPLVMVLGLLLLRIYDLREAEPEKPRSQLAILCTLLPTAAMVHALYIVRMGGDYMHGRLYLPVVFAAALPVFVTTVPLKPTLKALSLAALTIPFTVWLVKCGVSLRVKEANECGIGDERGWYAKQAHVDHPVLLGEYARHSFFVDAKKEIASVQEGCTDQGGDQEARCRVLSIHPANEKKFGILMPRAPSYRLRPDFDAEMIGVADFSAIGIAGYLAPDDVQVSDRLGLADPWAARLTLLSRGRPGHEKILSNAWMLGRYGDATKNDDLAAKAARHALTCGKLKELDEAVHAPLTAKQFFANMAHAASLQVLRIPLDPFVAESDFCGQPLPEAPETGGTGGHPFRWACPSGTDLVGLRLGYSTDKKAIARIAAVCTDGAHDTIGPATGDEAIPLNEIRCASPEKRVVGLKGRASNVVRQVALVCASPGGANEAAEPASIGDATEGDPFAVKCTSGFATGITGRAGSLDDAIGVVCTKDHP